MQNTYFEASCLSKNTSIEQLLVADPEVHSGPYPVTDSLKMTKGCRNKARQNLPAPACLLLLNQVLTVGEGQRCSRAGAEALAAGARLLPAGNLQASNALLPGLSATAK